MRAVSALAPGPHVVSLAMPPAPLLALLVACAELFEVYATQADISSSTIGNDTDSSDPGGCVYESRWHAEGDRVPTRDACLRCTCARGVISCFSITCKAAPDPPPAGCHVLHWKGNCCPELSCPDGMTSLEIGVSAPFDFKDKLTATALPTVTNAVTEKLEKFPRFKGQNRSTTASPLPRHEPVKKLITLLHFKDEVHPTTAARSTSSPEHGTMKTKKPGFSVRFKQGDPTTTQSIKFVADAGGKFKKLDASTYMKEDHFSAIPSSEHAVTEKLKKSPRFKGQNRSTTASPLPRHDQVKKLTTLPLFKDDVRPTAAAISSAQHDQVKSKKLTTLPLFKDDVRPTAAAISSAQHDEISLKKLLRMMSRVKATEHTTTADPAMTTDGNVEIKLKKLYMKLLMDEDHSTKAPSPSSRHDAEPTSAHFRDEKNPSTTAIPFVGHASDEEKSKTSSRFGDRHVGTRMGVPSFGHKQTADEAKLKKSGTPPSYEDHSSTSFIPSATHDAEPKKRSTSAHFEDESNPSTTAITFVGHVSDNEKSKTSSRSGNRHDGTRAGVPSFGHKQTADKAKLKKPGTPPSYENHTSTAVIPSLTQAIFPVCVEGGKVFGAGSALASAVACEQCFCLGGARRCVRPRCLPTPPACAPRPAPGACCPQRYYCTHATAPGTHDCEVEGTWYIEGDRVRVAEQNNTCTHCFCLRGVVRCQPLACAPPLHGCVPLVRPDECCPHRYQCQYNGSDKFQQLIHQNSLISARNDDRSLHTSKSNNVETSTRSVSTSSTSKTISPSELATKIALVPTTKVKRKTNEPVLTTSQEDKQNASLSAAGLSSSTTFASTTEKLLRSNFETSTTDDLSNSEHLQPTSTQQPENSVRIVINGTINCTAELSSSSLPLNLTANDTERIKMDAQPRIPINTPGDIESHTFNPNDIITDRSASGDFEDDEMFTINVTSSLSANSSHVTPEPSMSTVSKITVPTDLPMTLNITKKTNEFDFDYAEPTLPPSLPNLKIIPFVAADAVVDDDESPKESLTYPILEREDKYPVYYPTLEAKVTPYASRREDVYHPTQYPVFTSDIIDTSQYPLTHEVDITSSDYPAANNNLHHERTVSTSLETRPLDVNKAVTKTLSTSTTFRLETPSVNLFSPPVETEGGFIPKGPGIIDEYYAVYPSTPSGPSVPHLTTSMQLDTVKECMSPEGHYVPEGTVVKLACSVCSCTWGKVHCIPRPCVAPEGCYYKPNPPSTKDDTCCGELICVEVTDKETTASTVTTERVIVKTNESTNASVNTSIDKIIDFENGTMKVEIAPDTENKNSEKDIITTVSSKSTDGDNRSEDIASTSAVTATSTFKSTEAISTSPSTTTTTVSPEQEEYQTHSLPDYEENEEEEGFFGNVLKLLLSDSYGATTASSNKKMSVVVTTEAAPTRVTTTSPPTSKRPELKPTVAPFVPMPNYPYAPPKKTFQPNTVNRIDHLVLGEATAIRKPSRPVGPFKPLTTKPTTQKPFFNTKPTTRREAPAVQTSVTEGPRPPADLSLGVGGLKLAGCNIYGRMYRVERVIVELSTSCQECRCTEQGVQCRPLAC